MYSTTMRFTLFIISLLGALAFNRVRVLGKNILGKRKCSDDMIDILGLRNEYETVPRIIAQPQTEEEEEGSWLDGEVPWTFNKKNDTDDNSTITVKIMPTPDPFEPCAIGHLLFNI